MNILLRLSEWLVDNPLVYRLGWALIHLVWQGAVVALLLLAALWLMRRQSASLRYVCSCVGLAAFAMCFPVTALWLEPGVTPASEKDPRTSAKTPWFSASATPPRDDASPTLNLPTPDVESLGLKADGPAKGSTAPEPLVSSADRLRPSAARTLTLPFDSKLILPWLVGCWASGVFCFATWNTATWIYLRRLCHRNVKPVSTELQRRSWEIAKQLCARTGVPVLESSRVMVPSVIGALRPIIFLPTSVLTGLSPAEIDAILAHELAHIRRHDYLVNLIQVAIESIFFFHPVVWWIGHHIRMEREHCCDDIAAHVANSRLSYANALLRVEELCGRHGGSTLAVASSGSDCGSLAFRIRRIVGLPQTRGMPAHSSAVGAFILVSLIVSLSCLAWAAKPTPAELVEARLNSLIVEGKEPLAMVAIHDKKLLRELADCLPRIAGDAPESEGKDSFEPRVRLLLNRVDGTSTTILANRETWCDEDGSVHRTTDNWARFLSEHCPSIAITDEQANGVVTTTFTARVTSLVSSLVGKVPVREHWRGDPKSGVLRLDDSSRSQIVRLEIVDPGKLPRINKWDSIAFCVGDAFHLLGANDPVGEVYQFEVNWDWSEEGVLATGLRVLSHQPSGTTLPRVPPFDIVHPEASYVSHPKAEWELRIPKSTELVQKLWVHDGDVGEWRDDNGDGFADLRVWDGEWGTTHLSGATKQEWYSYYFFNPQTGLVDWAGRTEKGLRFVTRVQFQTLEKQVRDLRQGMSIEQVAEVLDGFDVNHRPFLNALPQFHKLYRLAVPNVDGADAHHNYNLLLSFDEERGRKGLNDAAIVDLRSWHLIAQDIKEDLSTFQFHLEFPYRGPASERPEVLSLTLSTQAPRDPELTASWQMTEQISQAEAAKIVDLLALKGLLGSTHFVSTPNYQEPNYRMVVQQGDRLVHDQTLGWDERLRQRLALIRTVLSGDAAKSMDRLVDSIHELSKVSGERPHSQPYQLVTITVPNAEQLAEGRSLEFHCAGRDLKSPAVGDFRLADCGKSPLHTV